jgi:D-arabinose 1-dehydrogenase-like Zn-dependent alcohol dehydrogenase
MSNTNHQDRIMRTYEVTLTSEDADTAVELVNLSYELNEQLDAVNGQGTVVTATSIAARIEVLKRLRKLAEREATLVTTDLLENADCDIRMVRQAFVKVPVDAAGVPIPHRQ